MTLVSSPAIAMLPKLTNSLGKFAEPVKNKMYFFIATALLIDEYKIKSGVITLGEGVTQVEMAALSPIRVLFIGAGSGNFGGNIGPWNHSRRLEKLGGVKVVAIADPDLQKAQRVLEVKLTGESAEVYRGCLVVASYLEALQMANPQVAFIGKGVS